MSNVAKSQCTPAWVAFPPLNWYVVLLGTMPFLPVGVRIPPDNYS